MKVLGHHIYPPMLLLVVLECAAAGVAFVASHWLFGAEQRVELASTLVFSGIVSVGVAAVGLYQAKQRLKFEGVLARVVVGLGVAAVGLAALDFLIPVGLEAPILACSFALTLLLVGVMRMMFLRWVGHEAFRRRVLIYGAGRRAATLLKLRRSSDQRGFRVAAFVPAPGDCDVLEDDRTEFLDKPLSEFARDRHVDEIVVAMDDRRGGFPIEQLLKCKFAGIEVVDLVGFLERETGKLNVDLVNPSWLIFAEGMSRSAARDLAARLLDLASAAALLLVAAPIMIAVAVVIAVSDGFPVLYKQQRVGLNCRVFTLYKFRSMVKNAESNGQAQWADPNDKRATRVGRVIRNLRLDELPQILNVIRGDMSLVGPRPERPEFVEQLSQKIPYYHERHSVRPGITGWAQLSYPYGSSEHDAMEKLQYDLYYIKHKSLVFNLIVLLQTAEIVLWRKGAR